MKIAMKWIPAWAKKWWSGVGSTNGDKLALLIFDKLVIGLAIGVAYFGLQIWTARDARENERKRDIVDHNFKRADYVKTLVPMVVNDEESPAARIRALAALVSTESIDADTATGLALGLLNDRVIGEPVIKIVRDLENDQILNRTEAVFGPEGNSLSSVLESLMPQGLLTLLDEFDSLLVVQTVNAVPPTVESAREAVEQANIAGAFLGQIVLSQLRAYPERTLDILGSVEFAVEHPRILAHLVRTMNARDAEICKASTSPIARFVGSIRWGEDDSSAFHAVVSAKSDRPEDAFACGAALDILMEFQPGVTSMEIVEEALDIVIKGYEPTDESRHPLFTVSASQYRFDTAARYISYDSSFWLKPDMHARVVAEIEKFCRQAGSRMGSTSPNAATYVREAKLIGLLARHYISHNYQPSVEAANAMSCVFSLEESILEALGIAGLRDSWDRLPEDISELVGRRGSDVDVSRDITP